jgi:hypothetical protein
MALKAADVEFADKLVDRLRPQPHERSAVSVGIGDRHVDDANATLAQRPDGAFARQVLGKLSREGGPA